jgi:hypothetical protein
MALEYYPSLHGVEPARVGGSMVEYCCANLFSQGVELIFEFDFHAAKVETKRDVETLFETVEPRY